MTLDAWRLAVGTLTVLPVAPPGEIDRPMAARAMALAPVAAVPLGLCAAVVGWLGWTVGLPSLLVGLIMVAALALGTRALHLDGLADTVDGLGSGRSAERALEIMKQGDLGPMGAVALILVLGAQAVAFSSVVDGLRGAAAAGLVVCCSRAALVVGCRRGVPAARRNGLAWSVAGTVPLAVSIAVWLLAIVVLVAAADLLGRWWLGVAAGVVSLATVLVLVGHAVRRLGGITGDVLGATVEIALTVMIICVAA